MGTTHKVKCRWCGRLREHTRSVAKSGGGTYRRGGRSYRGETCLECVENLLCYANRTTYGDGELTLRTYDTWSASSLLSALASFIRAGTSDLDEARWATVYARANKPYESFDEWYPALVAATERALAS